MGEREMRGQNTHLVPAEIAEHVLEVHEGNDEAGDLIAHPEVRKRHREERRCCHPSHHPQEPQAALGKRRGEREERKEHLTRYHLKNSTSEENEEKREAECGSSVVLTFFISTLIGFTSTNIMNRNSDSGAAGRSELRRRHE